MRWSWADDNNVAFVNGTQERHALLHTVNAPVYAVNLHAWWPHSQQRQRCFFICGRLATWDWDECKSVTFDWVGTGVDVYSSMGSAQQAQPLGQA